MNEELDKLEMEGGSRRKNGGIRESLGKVCGTRRIDKKGGKYWSEEKKNVVKYRIYILILVLKNERVR